MLYRRLTIFLFLTLFASCALAAGRILPNNVIERYSVRHFCPIIDETNVHVKDKDCGLPNGAISGITATGLGTVKYQWVDRAGKPVGPPGKDVSGLDVGWYRLEVRDADDCPTYSKEYEIKEVNVIRIITKDVVITPAPCGGVGSITGLKVNLPGPYEILWQNSSLKTVGDKLDLIGQPNGQYYLTVTTPNVCVDTYTAFIGNVGGPQFDYSKAEILPLDCTGNNGSIQGVQVTGGVGELSYVWYRNGVFYKAGSPDLDYLTAASYTLKVTDEAGCSNTSTPFLVQKPLGNPSHLVPQVILATCTTFGSVIGLKPRGYQSVTWRDEQGTIVATTADLKNVPGGTYRVELKNCDRSEIIRYYLGPSVTKFKEPKVTIKHTCIDQSTGAISLTRDDAVVNYRWVDGKGNTLGTGPDPQLSGLGAGDYNLYVTDTAGCERAFRTYTILASRPIRIVPATEVIIRDHCGTGIGYIQNIQATGGLPPYSYTWTNTSGKIVSRSADARQLTEGDYTVTVSDSSKCYQDVKTYRVENFDTETEAPVVKNIKACTTGALVIPVIAPTDGFRYRLYDTETSTEPLDEQSSGSFTVNIKEPRSYYISALLGHCESMRTKVDITIGITPADFTNTITPNGDGINDTWQISNISSYPKAVVQIFSRGGQMVYHSVGYGKPFDGTFNSRMLPAGTYYYVVDFNAGCPPFSGSLSVLR